MAVVSQDLQGLRPQPRDGTDRGCRRGVSGDTAILGAPSAATSAVPSLSDKAGFISAPIERQASCTHCLNLSPFQIKMAPAIIALGTRSGRPASVRPVTAPSIPKAVIARKQ